MFLILCSINTLNDLYDYNEGSSQIFNIFFFKFGDGLLNVKYACLLTYTVADPFGFQILNPQQINPS